MTLEQDWDRVTKAFLKAKNNHWNPRLYIYAPIGDLRKVDNKGIDFAIRRLRDSDEYGLRVKLYGGIHNNKPRYPLRCYDPMFRMVRNYKFVGIPEL